MIKDEIENMKYEIEQSTKGQRSSLHLINPDDHQGYLKHIDTSSKSTFPDYLQGIFNGQGTTQKFLDAVKRGKGPVWDRIALVAIDRLENGYKNQHGYDEPSRDFKAIFQAQAVPF